MAAQPPRPGPRPGPPAQEPTEAQGSPGKATTRRLAAPSPHARRAWWAIYLALLVCSHALQMVLEQRPDPDRPAASVAVPLYDAEGPVPGESIRIAYRCWRPTRPVAGEPAPPVLLLHGSPGDSANFERLGPLLASHGFEVFAPDLPGFGASGGRLPDYSILAHARTMLALLEALGLERAHVAGWSQGGGVGLHMADLAPDRVASLTLMASIGVQEAEGSGSYHFEQFKYSVGYVGLVLGGELVPHFGLLGSHAQRRAFIRNFRDSDQRPLREIMAGLETPTLILHADGDFLTPLWAATESHELIGPSRLLVVEGSHFLPLLQPELSAEEMADLAAQVEAGRPLVREAIDRTAEHEGPFERLHDALTHVQRIAPWWSLAAVCALLAWRWPERAAALAGLAVAMVWLDAGLAAVGLFAGVSARSAWAWAVGRSGRWERLVRATALRSWAHQRDLGRMKLAIATRLQPWRRDEALAAMGRLQAEGSPGLGPTGLLGVGIGAMLWTGAALLCAIVGATLARALLHEGLPELALGALGAWGGARLGPFLCTRHGRWRLRASAARAARHEFWPTWAFYAPLVPWLACLSVRHGGTMTFTCVNPAIGAGGGIVGESKARILRALPAAGGLGAVPLDPGPLEQRLDTLRRAFDEHRLGGGYPVVLKPDAGQKGYAVRVARSEADARDYLQRMPRRVVAQAYHPGPIEVGVLWVRDPRAEGGRVGRIFSITSKAFPSIEGDGRHTLEELILRHRRYRCQADTLLDRFAGCRLEIPDRGERVELGAIGNHAQGAIFSDGSHLRTPELEAWIDRAAAGFDVDPPAGVELPPGDNGLDYGRFDIRASSERDLRAARGLGIVELNGTTAESTNIYDPGRTIFWAWGVLFRQWTLLYRLGAARRAAGVRPMGLRQLRRAWQEFEHDRPDLGAAR